MASRTIKAGGIPNNEIILNRYGIIYSSDFSFGSAVPDSTVTSGTIKITGFRTLYASWRMYLQVHIGDNFVCRSQRFTFGEDYGTLNVAIDMSSGINEDLLLTANAQKITVYFVCPEEEDVIMVGIQNGSTVTITANHKPKYSACGAPTSVYASPDQATPGGTTTLRWSGATCDSGNSIKGYEVYRATSASGAYSKIATVTTSSKSGSTSVTAPSTLGSKYFYKIKTLSVAAYCDSGLSTAYATLTATNPTACGAPTACAVDSTLSLVATTLRWSGATSGVSNNISKYEVQRRSRTHKGDWGAWSAFQTTSGTSLSVSPPATAGHYYQYRVRAQGTAGETYYSGWKESTNTLRKAHQTVPEFTDPTLIVGLTDIKAVHITELQEALNNILLPFMDENKIAFIAIDKNSDAKHWGDHVQELKTAIDSTGVSHDSWVVMQDEVTADVIEQIRRIVRTM